MKPLAIAALILTLVAAATTVSVEAGLPHLGDTCFTSRAIHTGPTGNPDTHPLLNTTQAFSAFFANRLDWIYTVDAGFLAQMKAAGVPVSAAINANVPDTIHGPATYDIGRVVNLTGHRLTAPWMRQWKQQPYYGCINDPTYVAIKFERAAYLLNSGASSLQHDDPHCNAEVVSWKDGGCYCSHCMSKFGAYAAAQVIVNSSSFDYQSYLLQNGGYSAKGKLADALRVAFEAFQFESTVQHMKDLRAFLNRNVSSAHNNKKNKRRRNAAAVTSDGDDGVVLSCNNGNGLWDNITSSFDFGIGELSSYAGTPEDLLKMFLHPSSGGTLPDDKLQVLTMPKKPAVTTELKVQTRKVIATATALGGWILAPWDIYLPTPNAERFYGNVSDFADLYETVAKNRNTFAEFDQLLHTWRDDGVVRFVSGSDIKWTLRGVSGTSSSRKQQHDQVKRLKCNRARLQLHVVDWNWASNTAAVMYPLPLNNNTAKHLALVDLSQMACSETSTLSSATAKLVTLSGSVSWKLLSGTKLQLQFDEQAVVPWAVVDFVLDWQA